MAKTAARPSVGRYRVDRYGNARPAPGSMPATGLGRPPVSLSVRTAVAAVDDPWTPGAKIQATVNRRVDVLEDERSHGRISEAAYREGRVAQAVFERVRGPGSSNWQGATRVDAQVAKELAIIHGIETADRIGRMVEWMRRELGRIDANILQRVLGEGKSYADAAALRGQAGERGQRHVAQRFREALEQLAELKAAKGSSR